ncbi:hypothetical protein GCM10019071_04270 [Sphingobium fuliginis]|uniref:Mobile element protein n=1 Tax=Sphingobium fuliginis (strain ATCC 27551) TaxID=336203 RepID=A0ABQ1EMK6_SPHSA|nr:hypothetical protein GCM10019071_04270 [Sphingobium fuliginis]
MGWRGICAVLQRLSQKLATLAPTPNPSRLREGNVLNWPFPDIPNLSTRSKSRTAFAYLKLAMHSISSGAPIASPSAPNALRAGSRLPWK